MTKNKKTKIGDGLPLINVAHPTNKTVFKTISIDICEVENGFEVSVDHSFNNDSVIANTREVQKSYIAKTDAEVLKIINEVYPKIKQGYKFMCEEHYLPWMDWRSIHKDLTKGEK